MPPGGVSNSRGRVALPYHQRDMKTPPKPRDERSRRAATIGAITAIAAILCIASGCGRSDRPPPPQSKPSGAATAGGRLRVACTTDIVADAVRAIGGSAIDVVTLVPPGADPHTWRPGDAARDAVDGSALVVANGLGLEARAGDFLARTARSRTVVSLGDSIHPTHLITLPGDEQHFDPHVWFDPRIWIRVSYLVSDALGRVVPGSQDAFRFRAEEFGGHVGTWVASAESLMSMVPEDRRVLACSHDGGAYLARAFRWRYLAPEVARAELEGAKGDPMAELLAARRIGVLFATPGAAAEDRAQRLAVDAGSRGATIRVVKGLRLDGLGAPGTDQGTWGGTLLANAELISSALAVR